MEWTSESIHQLVEQQRKFFLSNTTLDIKWRITQLKQLKKLVVENEDMLIQALHDDLGRSKTEAFLCDILPTIREIDEAVKKTKKWSKAETHFSGILCFPSVFTKVYKHPYGVTLIVSPFNFPINLSIAPLIAAISAGNTAVIKASSKSIHCTEAMAQLFSKYFPREYICVVDGGHDIADYCLNERFDKIFYTGSPNVGKHVLELASKNLTPAALELGGETGNWCIVRKDANLKNAARKIAYMKLVNSGQICININQIAVAKEVADKLIDELKKAFTHFLGTDIVNNEEYSHLIGKRAYQWCADLADKYKDKIVFGGNGNIDTLRFSPTILYPIANDDPIVMEELFNPILPVVPFEDAKINDLLKLIEEREHGLALYIFTKNVKWAKKTMSQMQYGGGCINDTFMHVIANKSPFNGTGHSGMGAYHGEWGYREFSHPSTCLIGKSKMNLSIKEPPYKAKEKKALKIFGKK